MFDVELVNPILLKVITNSSVNSRLRLSLNCNRSCVTAIMVKCEFQAVILAAGRGSRMTDLTSGTPKCLLPVGGKPIICHTIKTLEKAGFQDVIIVVQESEFSEIQKSLSHNNVRVNCEFVSIPSDSEDWGTADSLKHLISLDKIKTDVLLVSCDLYTNSSINKLLYTYRQHKASFAALFFLPEQFEQFQIPGQKSKYKPEKDIVGIDLDTSRLMFLASASDFEENVYISRNILKRHPKFSLRMDLIDGHFYAVSYNLARYLATETVFSTLKGEFFPHVVNKQHKRNFVNEESSVVNDSGRGSLFDFMKETKLEESIKEYSTFNDHEGDLKRAYHGDVVKCYAVIADQEDFGIRINSLQALCQANRLCTSENTKLTPDLIGVRISPTATVESNQVDSLTFVGGGSKIKEKTSIKTSVLGENCVVNPKTRLNQCIILNNVEISEGCVLENCIIANDSKIGKNCDLKSCLVGPSFSVSEGTKSKNQVLTKSEGLMEI